jgi:hypothetical protein
LSIAATNFGSPSYWRQGFAIIGRKQMDPLSNAERYLRQAEECIALAKVATSNKMRANHYATAERYLRLAEAEPTVTNRDAGPDRSPIPFAPSGTS